MFMDAGSAWRDSGSGGGSEGRDWFFAHMKSARSRERPGLNVKISDDVKLEILESFKCCTRAFAKVINIFHMILLRRYHGQYCCSGKKVIAAPKVNYEFWLPLV